MGFLSPLRITIIITIILILNINIGVSASNTVATTNNTTVGS